MSAFLQVMGVENPGQAYLEYLKAFQKSYNGIPKQITPSLGELVPYSPPKQNVSMPSVQFPANAGQIPSELNASNQLFILAVQPGMVSAFNLNSLNSVITEQEAMDRALDDAYVAPIQVNNQLMMVGLPRSDENLDQLSGIIDLLKQGQAQPAQSQASSVTIEEVPDEEAGSDIDVSVSDSDDEGERAAAARRAVDASQPQPVNEAAAASGAAESEPAQESDDEAEEPAASGGLSCLGIVCAPFRWIGALVLLPFRGVAALCRLIGRFFGLSS